MHILPALTRARQVRAEQIQTEEAIDALFRAEPLPVRLVRDPLDPPQDDAEVGMPSREDVWNAMFVVLSILGYLIALAFWSLQ